jgi:hypothetical protein
MRKFLGFTALLLILIPQFLDAQSLEWQHAIPGNFLSLPVVAPGGGVYVLSSNQTIYSFSKDGRLLWEHKHPVALSPHLMLAGEGLIVFSDRRGEVLAYSAGGSRQWSLEMEEELAGPPILLSDGRLLLLDKSGALYNLSPQGQLLWSKNLNISAMLGPISDIGGNFYLVNSSGRVYSYSAWGDLIWDTPSSINTPVVGAISRDGSLLMADDKGRLVSVSPRGYQDWELDHLAQEAVDLVQQGEDWLLLGKRGRVMEFSWQGSLKEVREPLGPSRLYSAISFGEEVLYHSERGLVRMNQDQVLWQNSGSFSGIGASQEGVLVALGEDWILRSWRGAQVPIQLWSQKLGTSYRRGRSTRDAGGNPWAYAFRHHKNFRSYLSQIRSGSRAQQADFLRVVEGYRDQGNLFQQMPYAHVLLVELAKSGVAHRMLEEKALVNSHSDIRLKAYSLLGDSAHPYAREYLLQAAGWEEDRTLRRQIWISLAKLGSDFDGRTRELLSSQVRKLRHSEEAESLILALWALGQRGSEEQKRELAAPLVDIAEGLWDMEVRKKAYTALESLLE